MFTLKIKWFRVDDKHPYDVVDETTHFIQCDKVSVHGVVTDEQMRLWDEADYHDYRINPIGDGPHMESRLIMSKHQGKETWYCASLAWLLGPDGKTIEKLV